MDERTQNANAAAGIGPASSPAAAKEAAKAKTAKPAKKAAGAKGEKKVKAAKPAKAAKAAKPAKAPKAAKATGDRSARINPLATIEKLPDENPGRKDSHRGNVFEAIKVGQTVAEAIAAVTKKFPESGSSASGVIRFFRDSGAIKLKEPAKSAT